MLSDRPLMWGIFSSKARHFRADRNARLCGLLMFSIKSVPRMDGSKGVLRCRPELDVSQALAGTKISAILSQTSLINKKIRV